MLHNMKIKKSMILVYGITILVALTSIIALIASMNRVAAGYRNVIDSQVTANQLVLQCRTNTNIAARYVREMALVTDTSGNASRRDRINEVLTQLDSDLKQLDEVYPLDDNMVEEYRNA